MSSLSRKISSSTNFLFFVLIIAGFLVLLNFLAVRHFGRLDLTQNKIYTLSDSSRKVASNLDDIVTITCYFSKNLPTYVAPIKQQVTDMLDEYRAYAKGNIKVEFLDPGEDPAIGQKMKILNIPEVQLNIMEKDRASVINVYMGMAISYGNKQEVLPFVKDVANLEYEITSSILKITRKEEKKTVGFLAGNVEHAIDRGGDYKTVNKELNRQYGVETVDLSSGKPVPANINVLVVAGPKSLADQDKYAIDQYIMKGGKAIFLVDIADVSPEGGTQAPYQETNLLDMLENYGVRITRNLVLDRYNLVISFQTGYDMLRAPYPFYLKVVKEENGFNADSPIVNQLSSMVFPWGGALESLQATHKDLQITVLAQSSRYSWPQKYKILNQRKTGWDLNPLQEFSPQPKDVKPYPLAMLVSGKFKSFFADKDVSQIKRSAEEEKNKEEKPETVKQCEKPTQIIVVGNARFINDNFSDIPGNMEFFLNAVDWFTWGKDLIGVRSRMLLDRTLPVLSEQQKTAIKFANLIGVPVLFALFGIIRFYVRKKKKITLETLK